MSSGNRDVLELWRRLRQESLFVTAEREGLNRLHCDLKDAHYKLLQQLYLTRRLQSNQQTAESGGNLEQCCIIEARLNRTKFNEMSMHESETVARFLKSLKENPTLVAACLVYGEKMQLETTSGFSTLLETVVLSLFGQSCATQNHQGLLEFIQCLMLHQIGSTDRPRHVLKRGAFISTYRLLVEALPESRLFLTAALYQPIVQVLLDEGPPLEINQEKVCDYFSPRELMARFGTRGTAEFQQKVAEFCGNTKQRLDDHVRRFSHAIEQSLACFPSAIAYVIGRAHSIVSDGGMCPPDEARTLAADLLLQDFICLAIVNPERYGVTGDLPITETSRINLIQIAQHLQRAVMSPERHNGGFLTRMVEEVLTLDSGDNSTTNRMNFEDRTVICTRDELRRLILFLRRIQASEVRGVDAMSLANINAIVANMERAEKTFQREKSPQSKFMEKTNNLVDKIDKKMKQIQVDGIKNLDSLKLDADELVEQVEEVFLIPLPGVEEEFKILTESDIVNQEPYDMDDRGSIDDGDDGVSRGSKSNYSEVDENDRASSSSSVSDHLSSLHGSAGAPVDVDRLQDETDSIAESNPNTNRDVALQALDLKMPTSRESIEDRMRKFELGVRFDIQNDRFDARSDCWSTDVAGLLIYLIEYKASEPSEPLTEADYASRLEEIAEDPSEQLRVPAEDSRSDIWSVECLVPREPLLIDIDNDEDEVADSTHSPPAEEIVRSRASTPGLSYQGSVASSSAFSELKTEPDIDSVTDNRSDDGRGSNRSPRPSVLLPTKGRTRTGVAGPGILRVAGVGNPVPLTYSTDRQFNLAWQEQQAQLQNSGEPAAVGPALSNSASLAKQPVRVSPTELQENDDSKPSKMTSRRPFGMIKGLRKPSNVMKPRASLPTKLLPSALRTHRNTSNPNSDSPLLNESAFDVMAKYQTLTTQKKDEQLTSGQLISLDSPSSSVIDEKRDKKAYPVEDTQSRLDDVRRKLRYVLSASDPVDSSPMHPSTRPTSQQDKMLELLRAQSYEALAIQDRTTAAQLQETVRTIEPLTHKQTKQVLDALWKEYNHRAVYVRYLVRARQKLLGALAHIRRMARAGERVQETSRRHFLSVAASIFLKKKSDSLQSFSSHYNQMQTMDDKAQLVDKLLQWLFGQVAQEQEWQNTQEADLQEIQLAVHRTLLSRQSIYHMILYPNREVDIQRDQVFSDHIAAISARITPQHPKLQIPSKYCRECPWPSAQEEAKLISVYRTPQEKMMQTSRLCKAILNLLKLSNPQNVPGADDLVPVLVFVIIKANPPSLLSMIQYVETFQQTGSGEESFYWMQFTAACKFIQTIEC